MKSFNFSQHLLKVLIVFALSRGVKYSVDAIRLNENGGYDIVVGVEGNTPEPLNVLSFLSEIRVGIEQFSMELWKATHHTFFINSVNVIVPGNWWTLSNFETATWQTLLGSEIRISHDTDIPNSVNPNACGASGLYIELPDTFFKASGGGKYGPVGKALVNLWARYRFGVWEEHGFPGDIKFPYFYANPSSEPKWEATGCSNEEIIGAIRTVNGEISDRCSAESVFRPDDDCRFVPSASNTANSSLMNLHWLASVVEFCDQTSHNYGAPNRQNLFCGQRSVWQVIRESDDYKRATSSMESVPVPVPQFTVLKESRSPEFYILLDRGRTLTPQSVLQDVMDTLLHFVAIPSIERNNIAIGTYPHTSPDRSNSYVQQQIDWAPISSVFNEIDRVFNESIDTDGPVVRDFGLAIQQVAQEIKQRDHLAGTVILVIKRGATPNLFDKISFEQEVIASVKEDSRIQVFAVEAEQHENKPYTNLQSLTAATMGEHHLINGTDDNGKAALIGMLAKIQEKLEQSSIMNSLSSWTTQKQYTEAETAIEIPIYDSVNHVKVHLTTNRQLVASDILLQQVSGQPATLLLTEKADWNENSDLSRRETFTYTILNPTPGSIFSLRHGCHTENVEECRFFLLVNAHNDRPTPRVGITDLAFDSQSITIDVSTSAGQRSRVDMSDQGVRLVPFAIYAKIEMNQQRVLGVQTVTALVQSGGDYWIVPLADDGLGFPDVAVQDGIYSGIFTPLEDGVYQISVAARQVVASSLWDLASVNNAGSLMPVDQHSFGCSNSSKPRCAPAAPRGSFSRVQDIQRTVVVENAETFRPGKPAKILDLNVTTLANYNLQIDFTSPSLFGSEDDPEEFLVYMAPSADKFVGSTDLAKLIVHTRGEPSGSQVQIRFNAAAPPEATTVFYAVEAVFGGQRGGPSNVVGVVPLA